MNSARPEAETEYSRARPGAGNDSGRPSARSGRVAVAVLVAGGLGSALLLAAEFTPLLTVRSSAVSGVVATVGTGPHNSYALVPVALLAFALAYAVWRTASRLALLATGVLGLLALLISLLGDLPDARASGLIGSAATRFASASASPSTGLYLETLGSVVLLITAAAGLLLLGSGTGPRRAPRQMASSPPTRSAS
jgi:hypothetical protein